MMAKNTIRVALITLGLLVIPLVLQLTIGTGIDGQGWNWGPEDFVVMGIMVFIAGLLIDLAWRKTGKNRAVAVIVVVFLFLWLWAELAVGVFTNWGN